MTLDEFERHSYALTPFVMIVLFVAGQILLGRQLRDWRVFILHYAGLLDAIAARMGLTPQEEQKGIDAADARAPNGQTWVEVMEALSTAAIERDQALAKLGELQKLLTPPPTPANGEAPSPTPSTKPASA